MIEIIFKEWKEKALRGRNKKIGKIIKSYWRLHYDKDKDNVSLWIRVFDEAVNTNELYNERLRVFTIDNQSNLTINIANIYIDQSLQCLLSNDINFDMKIVPSKQRENYVAASVHEFQHKKNRFIYVPNQTIFNTYGDLIGLGDYTRQEIDKEFNKKITKLSKIFREKLNVIGNLMDLNLNKVQIHDKFKGFNNRIDFNISHKEIFEDLQLDVIDKIVFIRWQKYSYIFDNSLQYFANTKKLPLLDVRKQSQKAINSARRGIAQIQNKINYIKVKQNVKGPGFN